MNVLLIGIPGTGKSTLSQKFAKTHCILNPDSFRKRLWGSENFQGPWGEILAEMVTLSLAYPDKPILVDATCLHQDRRIDLMKNFLAKGERFGWAAVRVECPLHVALERNALRTRKVPEHIIEDMFDRLEEPEMKEGYQAIFNYNTITNKVDAYNFNNMVKEILTHA